VPTSYLNHIKKLFKYSKNVINFVLITTYYFCNLRFVIKAVLAPMYVIFLRRFGLDVVRMIMRRSLSPTRTTCIFSLSLSLSHSHIVAFLI